MSFETWWAKAPLVFGEINAAKAAFAAGAAESAAELKANGSQRMWDLVRFCREALVGAELITDEEYALLAEDHPAVKRLEDYDAVQAELRALREENGKLREAAQAIWDQFQAGNIVRDASKDYQSDWALKQLPLMQALGKLQAVLAAKTGE